MGAGRGAPGLRAAGPRMRAGKALALGGGARLREETPPASVGAQPRGLGGALQVRRAMRRVTLGRLFLLARVPACDLGNSSIASQGRSFLSLSRGA